MEKGKLLRYKMYTVFDFNLLFLKVTSTVNIKTPEFTESDAPFSPEEEGALEPPFSPQSESAWRGGISMQDVAKFNVSAHEVGLKRNILPVQWHIVQCTVQCNV